MKILEEITPLDFAPKGKHILGTLDEEAQNALNEILNKINSSASSPKEKVTMILEIFKQGVIHDWLAVRKISEIEEELNIDASMEKKEIYEITEERNIAKGAECSRHLSKNLKEKISSEAPLPIIKDDGNIKIEGERKFDMECVLREVIKNDRFEKINIIKYPDVLTNVIHDWEYNRLEYNGDKISLIDHKEKLPYLGGTSAGADHIINDHYRRRTKKIVEQLREICTNSSENDLFVLFMGTETAEGHQDSVHIPFFPLDIDERKEIIKLLKGKNVLPFFSNFAMCCTHDECSIDPMEGMRIFE